jgi:uncharacterized protein YprB with RNaseH-like and TPR domain
VTKTPDATPECPTTRTARRRLFFDIETSPNVGLFWQSGYKLTIPHENIIQERAIICVCWKWAGETRVHSLSWDDGCDKELLETFVPIMHIADEVVTQNGDKFDIPWLRTRCMKHQVPMAPHIVSIDTKKEAERGFYFNSTSLAYMGRFLDLGSKAPTGGFNLWKQVLLGNDPKALRKMVRYCKQDVVLLEKLWDRMNPYVRAKSHAGATTRDCPECGSAKVVVNKRRLTAAGYRKLSLQCTECGKYHTVAESRWERPKAVR